MSPLGFVASLLLCLSPVSAWTDCAFPKVDWFALDEGAGISYAYSVAAMNGNMYSGGYAKGNFAFVGVTDGSQVAPAPNATIWGDATSDVQNLYIAEVSASGSMTKSWLLRGSAIQQGQIGHGEQTNSIDSHSGMHAMLDGQHLAVKGGFRQLLSLPDAAGTVWSSAQRANTKDQVPFVLKLDVSSTLGVGPGTTGWAKLMDTGYAGGATVYSVDGDLAGNMIVTFEGCTGFDASATSTDAFGRTLQGATTGCSKHVAKLAAADGAEVWKFPTPTTLSSCRTITDGSFFCGWSMSALAGTLDFGNSVTVTSVASRVGIVKYNGDGLAQWAKATASSSFGDLAVSKTGDVLAVVGAAPSQGSTPLPAILSRIDTTSGTEGQVLWSDAGGVGTHSFRGVEVTDTEVVAFGQVTGVETLTDTTGQSITLRTRGSYEVFVVAYNAVDGSGKYAIDGGGTGMEYFFAFASDPDSHDVYVGGNSRSEHIRWGDVTRKNVMYNGQPGLNNPDTSSAVGSSKAFVVKLKSTVTLPSCLNSCSSAFGSVQASDVKSGHCYIDRHCYAHGTSAPYTGAECRKCDATGNRLQWSSPDTSNACFIEDACVAKDAHKKIQSGRTTTDDPCQHCNPSISTGAYSLHPSCQTTTTMAATESEMVGGTQNEGNGSKQEDGLSDDIAIALIVIVSALLLITSLTLFFLVCKERRGVPVFAPRPLAGAGVTMGTPCAAAETYGSPVSTEGTTAAASGPKDV